VFGNDPAETAVGCIFQWTDDGRRLIVYPESIAEAKIQLPAGLTSLK
jgi:branched-chain amino acid transport system substrate-binding protein